MLLLLTGSFVTLVWLSSCQKETSQQQQQHTSSTKPVVHEIQIQDGRLVFHDLDHFVNTLYKLSEFRGDVTKIRNWEQKLPGFTSMRGIYQKATEEWNDAANTTFDEKQFAKKYGHIVMVKPDHSIDIANGNSNLATLLDEKATVIIGNVLHKFTKDKQIIISDNDLSKLEIAARTLKTDENQKIYIFDMIVDSDFRGNCGLSTTCTGFLGGNSKSEQGNRRVNATVEILKIMNVSPNLNQLTTLEWRSFLHARITSERFGSTLGFSWNWYPSNAYAITWGVGYDITSSYYYGVDKPGTTSGGTGWTTLSPLSEVDVTWNYGHFSGTDPSSVLVAFPWTIQFTRVGIQPKAGLVISGSTCECSTYCQ